MGNLSAGGHAPSGGGAWPSSWSSAGSRVISWLPTTGGRRKNSPFTQILLSGRREVAVSRTPRWTAPTCTSASSITDPCGRGPSTASGLPDTWSLSRSSAVPQSSTAPALLARALTSGGHAAGAPGAGGNPTSSRSPHSTTGSATSGTSQSPKDSGTSSISAVVSTTNTEGPVRSWGVPLRCSLRIGRVTWWANRQQAMSAGLSSEAISNSRACVTLSATTGRCRRTIPSASPCTTILPSASPPSPPGACPPPARISGGWNKPPKQSVVARCWRSLRKRCCSLLGHRSLSTSPDLQRSPSTCDGNPTITNCKSARFCWASTSLVLGFCRPGRRYRSPLRVSTTSTSRSPPLSHSAGKWHITASPASRTWPQSGTGLWMRCRRFLTKEMRRDAVLPSHPEPSASTMASASRSNRSPLRSGHIWKLVSKYSTAWSAASDHPRDDRENKGSRMVSEDRAEDRASVLRMCTTRRMRAMSGPPAKLVVKKVFIAWGMAVDARKHTHADVAAARANWWTR
mmetsp:Transcript_30006/g.77172  ORF Transcript_30006/g.77172 Transcript_30006/m.77172 type:complete len:514 (+) Transcript_30006:155-1696(+)